ncbi:hypothetical protein EYF80_033668 [Liparis tanakae]|uniref:Uncharacterized protein n=1 Tax=Liparis tanakae TaxID=230148 RepID=A0A4Z2GR17_9TELE|nr:hypothetical protein EYF80_033668 [Liparis tanakae]
MSQLLLFSWVRKQKYWAVRRPAPNPASARAARAAKRRRRRRRPTRSAPYASRPSKTSIHPSEKVRQRQQWGPVRRPPWRRRRSEKLEGVTGALRGAGGRHSVSSCWRRLFCWAWLFWAPCGTPPGPFWGDAAPPEPWFRGWGLLKQRTLGGGVLRRQQWAELTGPSKLLKQALRHCGVHGAAELTLHAAHQRRAGQFVVQRAGHGAEVAGVVPRREVELLLLLRRWRRTLRGPGRPAGPRGAGRRARDVLSHQHDLLLEELALAVLDAVELPLPLGQHLGVQRRLRRHVEDRSRRTSSQTLKYASLLGRLRCS